jgi:ferredoxin
MSHIEVDADLCAGSESCVALYPNAFRLGDNGTAEVLPDEESLTEEQRNVAVESCPVAALRLG